MASGKYFHFGLPQGLSRVLESAPSNEIPNKFPNKVIHVNVDGLPMCKGTKGDFWQILVKIVNFPYSAPFVCGLYYGPGKPNDFNEFLRRFIEEAHYLEIEGFHFQGKHLEFEV